MKYLFNVISMLLVIIWLIIFWSSNSFEPVDLLLVMAGLVLLIRILFNKQLTSKKKGSKDDQIPKQSLKN